MTFADMPIQHNGPCSQCESYLAEFERPFEDQRAMRSMAYFIGHRIRAHGYKHSSAHHTARAQILKAQREVGKAHLYRFTYNIQGGNMTQEVPIQHNGGLYPPYPRRPGREDVVMWGPPPALITALDAQDLAFLTWARNVTLDELEERTS